MRKLEDVTEQIRNLSRAELAEFRKWYAEFDAQTWDTQIEADVKAGKLDKLAEAAHKTHKEGNGARTIDGFAPESPGPEDVGRRSLGLTAALEVHMLRRFLPLVFMLISACVTTNVTTTSGSDLVAKGIYRAPLAGRIRDSSSPTGTRREPLSFTFVEDTSIIPAVLGTGFGVAFRVTVPGRDTVPVTVTWRFPPAGLSNPRTGQTVYGYTREIECVPYAVCPTGWTFEEAWELVPGAWEVQIAVGNRPPLKQSFTVVEP